MDGGGHETERGERPPGLAVFDGPDEGVVVASPIPRRYRPRRWVLPNRPLPRSPRPGTGRRRPRSTRAHGPCTLAGPGRGRWTPTIAAGRRPRPDPRDRNVRASHHTQRHHRCLAVHSPATRLITDWSQPGPHLSGWCDCGRVRTGNAAWSQHQQDVYGANLDASVVLREHIAPSTNRPKPYSPSTPRTAT